MIVLGENDALIRRGAPWSWCLSAYTAEVPTAAGSADRHNLVDLFHSELGLIAGREYQAAALRSTFTVGDPHSCAHSRRRESRLHTRWDRPAVDAHRRHGRRLRGHRTPRGELRAPVQVRREELLTEGFERSRSVLPAEWSAGLRCARADARKCRAGASRQALWLSDQDGVQSLGLRSPKIPAEPGVEYFAEAWWLGSPITTRRSTSSLE